MASSRIVIAGASSLLGAELKSLLEESRFAAADFRLLDEEIAAGTLTEAGGEAAVIRPVEEDSFDRANFIFFTGSAPFTKANLDLARKSGATIVDLSSATVAESSITIWFSNLESLRPSASISSQKLFAIPSAAAIAGASLCIALGKFQPEQITMVAFQPVSESGRKGIEELEQQTSQLLSFQSVGKPVFDTQVGFNLLDRFGPESGEKLSTSRERLRREVSAILGASAKIPAIQLIHAPVFYGIALTIAARLGVAASADELVAAAKSAGLFLSFENAPSNVSASGESLIQFALPEPDPGAPDLWWFWGAADNIRVPASNAVKLAEKLLA
jgi:aspartate-semialdehyde dehydrogenase